MKTDIIISRESTMPAEGVHINGNSKPVFCVTTGQIWPSVTDAAKAIGVAPNNLSTAIHKGSRCHGHVYKLMANAEESIPLMLARIQALAETEAKAAKWEAYEAEQEAARKAEEKRNADIAKAEAKVARREEISRRKHAEADKADELLNEAKVELDILKGNFE